MLMVFFDLVAVFCMCFPKFNFGSKVRPRILGSLQVGSIVLSIVRVRVVLNSAGSGVKSVVVVLDAFSDS